MNTYNKIPDEQLICRLRNGEDEIMDYLMIKYKSMVRRKARAMYLIGGDNDDLIQEGMIGLIKAVRDFDSEAGQSFSGFAELCVSRQMYSAIASSKRKKHEDEKALPLIDTIEPEVENNPETLYFGKESSEAFIEELKENLSDLENRVLYLHMLGTNYRDIANLLDKSPKTIDNALQRIRTKAGKLLSQ